MGGTTAAQYLDAQNITYGIVVPTGSPLRKSINEALLQLRHDGTLDDLNTRYFGDAGK